LSCAFCCGVTRIWSCSVLAGILQYPDACAVCQYICIDNGYGGEHTAAAAEKGAPAATGALTFQLARLFKSAIYRAAEAPVCLLDRIVHEVMNVVACLSRPGSCEYTDYCDENGGYEVLANVALHKDHLRG
jgi:hypothetical protein